MKLATVLATIRAFRRRTRLGPSCGMVAPPGYALRGGPPRAGAGWPRKLMQRPSGLSTFRSGRQRRSRALEGGCNGAFSQILFIYQEGAIESLSASSKAWFAAAMPFQNMPADIQKAATITVESTDDGVARIVEAVGEFWRFDEVGHIHRSLREAGWKAAESFPTRAGDRAVVDLGPKLKRKKWEQENRWDMTKDDLDLIAADLKIDGFQKDGPRLRAISGSAPRREPLTYEARSAIQEIEAVMFRITGQIERLTEPALKGLAFEATGRAEDDPLWSGIAAAAERRREILRRHRTGKGIWYAVIEGVRSERGSNRARFLRLITSNAIRSKRPKLQQGAC